MNSVKSSALALGFSAALYCPSVLAQSPYQKADDTWINIKGEVRSVSADSFTLDYGDAYITVEFDDGDRDADAYKLKKGDRVSVSGLIDDDFFETATIEASSVYVENLGTHFFASAVDEEDNFVTVSVPLVVSDLTVQGVVTQLGKNQFTVDTGKRALTVDVTQMLNNPLDDKGYQKLSKGDIVSVRGSIDQQLFDGREVEADSVVTLLNKKDTSKS